MYCVGEVEMCFFVGVVDVVVLMDVFVVVVVDGGCWIVE